MLGQVINETTNSLSKRHLSKVDRATYSLWLANTLTLLHYLLFIEF